MRKTKIIKHLTNEISILENEISTLKEKNDILQFMVDEGKIPVQFFNTGIMEDPIFQPVQKDGRSVRREKHNVRYIDIYGVITITSIGFLHEPIFKIVKNSTKECIFTATEHKKKPVWFKLCKAKRLVVEIPKPYEYDDYNNNN